MLSNPTRAAVCLTGFVLSGCMQSMPTAETITKPTSEAFARLASWTPWRPNPEPATVQVASATPVVSAPLPPPAVSTEPAVVAPRPVAPRPQPVAQLASARTRPAIKPTIPASNLAAPAAPADAPILPARVVCQTSAQPGDRVRMECTPAE